MRLLPLALLALALPAHAAVDALVRAVDTTVTGGLAIAATCINHADPSDGGPTGGTLRVRGIPAGATIVEARLYWSTITARPVVAPGIPLLDGAPLAPVSLGQIEETPCWPPLQRTGAFRADATAIVDGNGDYRLTGLFGDDTTAADPLTEGASLYVLWSEPTASPVRVVMYEGIDVASDSDGATVQTVSGFDVPATGPLQATFFASVGNGQFFGPDAATLDGRDLEAMNPSLFDGAACSWDDGLYEVLEIDVASWLTPTSTSMTLEMSALTDCYTLTVAGIVLSAPSCRSVEPSATDLDPSREPLLLAREMGRTALRLTWEDQPGAQVWQGRIGRFYDHAVVACDLAAPVLSHEPEPGDWYYLVAGCGPGGVGGRDSFRAVRPSPAATSGTTCP